MQGNTLCHCSHIQLLSKLEKIAKNISSTSFVLLGVENDILKVYQNSPIRKLLNWGGDKKGDFRILIGMNNY